MYSSCLITCHYDSVHSVQLEKLQRHYGGDISGNTSALSGQYRHIVPEIYHQGDPVSIGFCFRSFLSVIFDVVASIYYIVVGRAFVHCKRGDHVSWLVLKGSNGRNWGMGGKMSESGSCRAIPPCSRLKNLDDPVDKAQSNYYASIHHIECT